MVAVPKVVFITQQFDPDDPLLGAVVPQVAALARQVDEVVVVADRIVAAALPANARGRSFHSASKLGRGLRLLDAVARELPGMRRSGVVVAHMCPVYAIVVAPLVRPAQVPLVLWWCHSKVDRVVRTAERVSTQVVSVAPASFPLPSQKLVAIGHATDVAGIPARTPGASGEGTTLRALVLGRYGRVKGLSTIVRAARLALDHGVDLRLELYGPATTAEARADREQLERLVAELGLGGQVTLGGPVTHAEAIALLAAADLLVSNTYGGADKVVYEAAAAGLPVLSPNRWQADVLDPELIFHRDDAADLASRIENLAALAPAGRDAIGQRLRERVVRLHSVDSWAAGVLRAAGLAAPEPAGAEPEPALAGLPAQSRSR